MMCFGRAGAADSTSRFRVLPVPTLGYAPETRFYVGAVLMVPFQLTPEHRLAAAKLEASITQNRQRLLSASWDYYLGRDRGFSSGNILTARYPDYYWQPGSNTPGHLYTRFQARKSEFQTEYLKQVAFNKMFAGGAIRYASMQQLSYMEGDSFVWQGLNSGRLFGISCIGSHDSRDNLLNPHRGMLLRWQIGMNTTHRGNIYATQKMDIRWFHTEEKYTLALRLYVQRGNVRSPFFDLPAYGGDAARGYFTGRFRGDRLACFQTEWRQGISTRLGFTLFAGLGNAWMRSSGEALMLKPNGGFGFRFMADRRAKVNLRF
ncbi:MAG: BamA/TamA family outer membrane protein, partial [Bacteroidetes bacterium]|nr:BamA/TamA family outer membrane protein [Bacteroidota bacterium]